MKRLLLLIAALLLLSVSPFAMATSVRASADISATYDARVEFPARITFSIEATSPADITHIFLRYRLERITTVNITSVVLLEVEPARRIDTSWTWDMKKMLGSLPPGTLVHYSWRIRDVAGREKETAWRTVQFADDRHDWQSVAQGDVTLFWYRGTVLFARVLLDSAVQAQERLALDTGALLERPVQVYIYGSQQEMLDAMVYPQEWMGGGAFPDYGTIVLGIEPANVAWGQGAIAHEFAHLVTYQMTFNPYGYLPTWLNEGLSMYTEGELRPDFRYLFDQAVAEDGLISLQSLSSDFPTDVEAASLSYAESYSLVDFLLDTYGSDSLLRLLQVFKQGSTYDDALLEVYGLDTAGLENEWRATLGLAPRESPAAATPVPTATPEPSGGLFGCQAAAGEGGRPSMAGLYVVGLLLIPGSLELVRLRFRRGGK